MIKTKNNFTKKYVFKAYGILFLLILMSNQATAQKTSGDFIKGGNTVKVVDNKGTIKYFQSSNGITQITNTTNDKTTTTWQLGGTLTDNTYIDATGKVFALDGLALSALPASTNALSGSKNGDGGSGSGYTLLVRNEATGAVEKMLATSLITGGVAEFVLGSDFAAGVYVTAVIPAITTVPNKISVFRNGIKLRQTGSADWSIGGGVVTFTAAAGEFYTGDVIEIQWIN
ncbi:hypothetical protein QLS91_11870 [Flavobacterium sp. LB2P84]|uniref:Uncharacterized protein n=1 Tax=Flavobacterium yafengii TaxID=3041253 RepID=A0AAW6TPB8_9FLAO|nr:hypothetical protein [Flavobacterium yafengii]MDI5950319.1 hypothetical protein [Flavobacterium yafengii]MDI6033771.1 hypothetical protein [Flavobacterium yafengii]